jgi:hypothetical protein
MIAAVPLEGMVFAPLADATLSLDPPIRECGGWFLDAAQGVACGRSR